MSSTNRGYERHKTDYYITPHKPINDFLSQWFQDLKEENRELNPQRLKWFDPCAGGDATHGMSYPEVIKDKYNPFILETLDIREDSLANIKGDYLLHDIGETKPDVIITNPPFYLAKEIIEKGLRDVADNGYVVMLLRLNFFGSNDRFPFFTENMPSSAYVHHRRMSFTEDGKTDSIEYMHCVWKKGENPSFCKLKVI